MSTSSASSRIATRLSSRSAVSMPAAASAVAAAILLAISFSGPTWLHVPANPVAKTPVFDLSFGDLHQLTSQTRLDGFQDDYFAWLGWTTAVVVVVIAFAWTLTSARAAAVATPMVALAGLVLTLFGVKGPLSWGGFVDQLKYIRIGGYLLIVAYLVLLLAPLVLGGRGRRACG